MVSKDDSKNMDHKTGLIPAGLMGKLAKSALFWLAFLLILIGFTTLEFQLDQSLHGFIRKLLLIILLILEFGAIMLWDNLKNRYKG